MNVLHPDRAMTRAALASAALFGLGTLAAAQTNAPPTRQEIVSVTSGVVENTGTRPETIASFHVNQPGVPWMRLSFDNVMLSGSVAEGTGTVIKITSLHDGYFQLLNAKTIAEWNNTSAYLNGDLVHVELIAHPNTGPNRLDVDGVTVGLFPANAEPDTICFGADDREASNDPRAARLMPIGCTTFMINDAGACFVTAGHCQSGSVVQFNVPLSNSNGSTNNPPPSDQYARDLSSLQGNGGLGVGNDWAYFGVFPNSTTGLTPLQAQGATYVWGSPPSWNSSRKVRLESNAVPRLRSRWNSVTNSWKRSPSISLPVSNSVRSSIRSWYRRVKASCWLGEVMKLAVRSINSW